MIYDIVMESVIDGCESSQKGMAHSGMNIN